MVPWPFQQHEESYATEDAAKASTNTRMYMSWRRYVSTACRKLVQHGQHETMPAFAAQGYETTLPTDANA